jgi:hypothetical protein
MTYQEDEAIKLLIKPLKKWHLNMM